MNYLATLNAWAHIPPGSIYRGAGKFDFTADKLPDIAKEKLKEVTEAGVAVFTKAGEKVKTSSELKKEGKPVAAEPIKVDPEAVKDKDKPVDPKEPDGVVDVGVKKP